MNPCNPVRLGLVLNYTVYYHEQRDDTAKAIKLTEHALEEALGYIDDCDEQSFTDAEVIITMLKENLTLWKEENVIVLEADKEESVQMLNAQ